MEMQKKMVGHDCVGERSMCLFLGGGHKKGWCQIIQVILAGISFLSLFTAIFFSMITLLHFTGHNTDFIHRAFTAINTCGDIGGSTIPYLILIPAGVALLTPFWQLFNMNAHCNIDLCWRTSLLVVGVAATVFAPMLLHDFGGVGSAIAHGANDWYLCIPIAGLLGTFAFENDPKKPTQCAAATGAAAKRQEAEAGPIAQRPEQTPPPGPSGIIEPLKKQSNIVDVEDYSPTLADGHHEKPSVQTNKARAAGSFSALSGTSSQSSQETHTTTSDAKPAVTKSAEAQHEQSDAQTGKTSAAVEEPPSPPTHAVPVDGGEGHGSTQSAETQHKEESKVGKLKKLWQARVDGAEGSDKLTPVGGAQESSSPRKDGAKPSAEGEPSPHRKGSERRRLAHLHKLLDLDTMET